MKTNETMMQYFEWYLPNDGFWWKRCAAQAADLRTLGVTAVTDSPENRNQQIGGEQPVKVWSKFTFPGRKGKYSSFTWNHTHFTGTDWDENTKRTDQIYRFTGKQWDADTDPEKGNFDYLMGMNVDLENPEVISETAGEDFPAVGEYWSKEPDRMLHYLDAVENRMSLFDVVLHYQFYYASTSGGGKRP